jgi:flagellar protein FliO/FliZ
MIKASLLPRAAALAAALVLLLAARARAAAAPAHHGGGERTPVDLGASGHTVHAAGGGSIVRTIVGLAIVIGVIYGLAWVLKQVKAGREGRSTGAGLASVASVPLGSGRAIHLVRAGCELVLVGVAEHGVTPIRTYTVAEAQAAGLIDEDGEALPPLIEGAAAREPRRPRLALPRPRLALPATLRTAAAGAGTSGSSALGNRATARPAAGALDTLRAWTVRR